MDVEPDADSTKLPSTAALRAPGVRRAARRPRPSPWGAREQKKHRLRGPPARRIAGPSADQTARRAVHCPGSRDGRELEAVGERDMFDPLRYRPVSGERHLGPLWSGRRWGGLRQPRLPVQRRTIEPRSPQAGVGWTGDHGRPNGLPLPAVSAGERITRPTPDAAGGAGGCPAREGSGLAPDNYAGRAAGSVRLHAAAGSPRSRDDTVEAVWFVVGRRNTLSVEDSPDEPSSVAP
jgi:hypothetical protein